MNNINNSTTISRLNTSEEQNKLITCEEDSQQLLFPKSLDECYQGIQILINRFEEKELQIRQKIKKLDANLDEIRANLSLARQEAARVLQFLNHANSGKDLLGEHTNGSKSPDSDPSVEPTYDR